MTMSNERQSSQPTQPVPPADTPTNTPETTPTPSPEPPAPKPARQPWLPHLPGLDGLRAIAVIAVILYHLDLPWMPAGFLGVEVFFVISGYLITGLLLAEWRRNGRISLLSFWKRRARRLLPAVFVLLGVVLAFAVLCLPGEVAVLRGDVLAAAFYVSNWAQVFSNRSYFETMGRPPLLQHLWSLAVEEQFYLVWPLIFAIAMSLLHRLRLSPRMAPRAMAVIALGGAAASTALMLALYVPEADPTRVYYGTDTRAAGFLIGAALAVLWIPAELRGDVRRIAARALDLAGLAALIALVAVFVNVTEVDPALYQGGFAALALLTAVVIAATVHPAARLLPAMLSQRVLQWIGTRSYSIYLWHFPIFMVTRPQLDVPLDGLPLLALRLGLTALLSEASYRWIEQPIRNGALGRAWNALRESHGRQRVSLGTRWAASVSLIAVVLVLLGVAAASAQRVAPSAELVAAASSDDTLPNPAAEAAPDAAPRTAQATMPDSKEAVIETPQPSAVPAVASPTPTPASYQRELAQNPASPTQTPSPQITATPFAETSPANAKPCEPAGNIADPSTAGDAGPTPDCQPFYPHVTAIGDSVMLGAAKELKLELININVDAAISRQAGAAISLVNALSNTGQLAGIVVIDIGTNGYFTVKQFDQLMTILQGARRVAIVNVRVPRRWETANNSMLAEGVKRYSNAALVDWYGASADHPGWFAADGVHLGAEGRRAYVALIAAAVRAP
jgi:peptidoglycan/LPS O-acetylase OafA/YrhL